MLAISTARRGKGPRDANPNRSLEVIVLHTTIEGTLRALRTAAELADGLAARIRLVVLQVVPYPLSLNAPDVAVGFTRRRFWTIAADARVDTCVDIRLGRDPERMLESAIKPHSVVVMGGKKRNGWWPTREGRLAKRLERQGHQVMFARVA